MEKSIKNHLCKFVRGTGLSKADTHKYIDQIEKWYDSCGPEWTVQRLKDYHHWYITYQAGAPVVPEWFRHTKSMYPKGIMKTVFNQRNPQRALALLSVHTAFIHAAISKAQTEKFVKAVNAPAVETEWTAIRYDNIMSDGCRNLYGFPNVDPPDSPGYDCLTGTTIPCGKRAIRLNKPIVDRMTTVNAYAQSWVSLPDETLRFIANVDAGETLPLYWSDTVKYLQESGKAFDRREVKPSSKSVGRISFIQEPSLKARVIANPNRISQHFLRPLQKAWMAKLKKVPSDCTFNQERGVYWVKEKLRNGVQLSSTDLSSATDTLDLYGCLDIVHRVVMGLKPHNYNDLCTYSAIHAREQTLGAKWAFYLKNVTYFCEMSRARWESPVESGGTSWKRGQPLGTAPSFALLGLTNNAAGYDAACKAGLDPWDSFRVIGDDIIMDSRMETYYRENITRLGAEINDAKCISSKTVVEFAGRVITKSNDFLKRVKFKEVSDNQFIKLVGLLGEQSTVLLRPRQRRQYKNFKYVPGIVVEGPYSPNSYNEPLSDRYTWYLRHSGLAEERPEPEIGKMDAVQFCTDLYFSLKELSSAEDPLYTMEWFNILTPQKFSEDFQSSLATALKTGKGDPRLPDGKTMLKVFEEVSTNGAFQDYLKWKQQQYPVSPDSTQRNPSKRAHLNTTPGRESG